MKKDGYKTCPFDEMVSTYTGVVDCIEEKFQDFTNTEYLHLATIPASSRYNPNDTLLHHKKYKFFFNHESPGHADLYLTQEWPGGKNHYIENNYELFSERYTRRIRNFNEYVSSGHRVNFLITSETEKMPELHAAISHSYPDLSYKITRFPLAYSSVATDAYYAQKTLLLNA